KGTLETLSQREVQQLSETANGKTYQLFRQCALAILNTGAHSDNAKTILDAYKDFEVRIHQQDRGVRLELINAPADAFVDGEMIASTREMLFSALRDIVYTQSGLDSQHVDLDSSQGLTDYVFQLLRNARTLRPGVEPKIVVCWGGHSISSEEYKYTKRVGHELGLRSLDVCTGCGPGMMKGTMKGATLSHYNILNNGYMVGESLGLGAEDRLVIPVPLYHCFGMVMGNLGCVTHGSTMIYPAPSFDAEATLLAVAEERATALYGVPTMFIAELDHPRRREFDLSSLRTGIMAGATCPIEVMRRVIGDMHMAEVQIAYGMTETSPVSTQTSADDDLERRVTSVGRTQPHLESKIVDEHGAVVP
ncbi:pyrimidine/purine nucleosidase domain-containing protein, partial [Acinetobacter baumannii]